MPFFTSDLDLKKTSGAQSLPIVLLVEFEELTGGVRRKEAVVDVQSGLEGDECRVMLETERNNTV